MKTQNNSRTFSFSWITLFVGMSLAAFLPIDVEAAKGGGKGNGGKVGGDVSGVIYSKVTFHDLPEGVVNGVESDGGGPYEDGLQNVTMRIGRNSNIRMDFNTHKKKASMRTLHFPGGLPVAIPYTEVTGGCYPSWSNGDITAPDVGATGPDISLAAQDAELNIRGQDHDDTPLYCQRFVNARLTVKDDNGTTWVIHFGPRASGGGSLFAPGGDCMIVERTTDTQWKFSTAGTGYLYRDNNPPHAASEFWGIVSLPMSGTIDSLSDETAPTGGCNTYGDGNTGCPTVVCPVALAAPDGGGGAVSAKSVRDADRSDREVYFVRGDANGDGAVDLADSVSTLNYLFLGGRAPTCEDAADADDNGRVDISDGIYTLAALFSGSVVFPPPHPEPGLDPTHDVLACD